MNDCMTFPDTVEEFMEQYKVVDSEHIYTNGSEFVPIFRMKQWFKHLPSAQPEIVTCEECKYWDTTWEPTEEGYHYCWANDAFEESDFWCKNGERKGKNDALN